MYTLQGKIQPTRHLRFPRQSMYVRRTLPMGSPRTWQFFTLTQQSWTDSLLLRKSTPDSTSQPGWVVHGIHLSFSPNITIEAMRLSQTFVDNKLLGLPGTYHQHAIGTFNTCSRGPTHQYLTDTGGGYNLVGASLPIPLPDLPNQRSYTFHLVAPPGLRLSITNISL
jgi:hypothetical protein